MLLLKKQQQLKNELDQVAKDLNQVDHLRLPGLNQNRHQAKTDASMSPARRRNANGRDSNMNNNILDLQANITGRSGQQYHDNELSSPIRSAGSYFFDEED